MKTINISFILVVFVSLSIVQVIQLPKANVRFEPVALEKENIFHVNVKENYAGEFEKGPLVFMKNNFNIKTFIDSVKKEDYDFYCVSFRSKNGFLNVEIDEEGNLLKTYQKFINNHLPREISDQVYRDFKGRQSQKACTWLGVSMAECLEMQIMSI